MTPAQAQRAFGAKVQAILSSVDDLAEDAVKRAMEMLEDARRHALDELMRIPADSFDARHLDAISKALDRSLAQLEERYRRELPGLFSKAADLGADLGAAPFRSIGFTEQVLLLPEIPRQVVEVLVDYSADMIQGLRADALRKINLHLTRAILGTVSPYETIQAIAGDLPQSVFGTVRSRAETIFRTEANRVFEVSGQARLNEMGKRLPGLAKQWVAFIDSRTRETHEAANGQIVPTDATYTVGGYAALYPRDPMLPAAESINCRCHSIPSVSNELLASFGAQLAPV